ncbi:MAG: hypothetical protein ACRD63_05145 [Pyrinomonadaceae bacterium]
MGTTKILLFLTIVLVIPLSAQQAGNGTQQFVDRNADYTLDLPSPTWRVLSRPDGVRRGAEFIYTDRLDGYLRVKKESIEAGSTLSDVVTRNKEQYRFKSGFIDGKQDNFAGRLSGVVATYEYTDAGKPMLGLVYYLKADDQTAYILHFTGLRDKLKGIRSQTDSIARSLKTK